MPRTWTSTCCEPSTPSRSSAASGCGRSCESQPVVGHRADPEARGDGRAALFTRNNQAVELTQYGHKLLSDTTEFLLSHDRLVESLSPQMLTGKLRLGIPDSYAAHFMADSCRASPPTGRCSN